MINSRRQLAPETQVKTVSGRVLKQLSDLAAFPLVKLDELAGHFTVRAVKKNELVFDQDEDAKYVYIVLSGVVRLCYFSTDYGQTTVGLLPRGEFFGLDSLLPNRRHEFRCEAFENSSVGMIKPQPLIEILLGTPYDTYVRWDVAIKYPGRAMYVHCIKRIGMDVRKRVGFELLNLAERFGIPNSRGTLIALNISHEVLAGLVGASRQQVTQHLNEFDREKIILREGRRIIIKADRLRRLLEARQ